MVQVRTSYGMFIPRYQDEIIGSVEERLANWTGIPVVHQEDMQVCIWPAPHLVHRETDLLS